MRVRCHAARALLVGLVLLSCADPPEPGGLCGDGHLDPGERCDGDDFGGRDCRHFGYVEGPLICADDCASVVLDACRSLPPPPPVAAVCGDGVVDPAEECDGASALDCAAIGRGVGPLGCTAECTFDAAQCCQPSAELCNGLDDDCDRRVDEESCGGGLTCVEGRCAGCVPAPERCNGRDDDCDARFDEDFDLGQPCEQRDGACLSAGVVVCAAGAAVCDAPPIERRSEACGGGDDDCDGLVDEGDALCPDGAECVAGQCVDGCTPIDACAPDDPSAGPPPPQARVDHEGGWVMRLTAVEAADCERLRLRADKLDGTPLGEGDYDLRVGTCRPEAVVRMTRHLDAPADGVVFEVAFGGAAGEAEVFCVTKAAEVEVPRAEHAAWWYSDLTRISRAADGCP